MIKTRSNIVYTICKLNIFNVNSTAIHWKALKRVLRYLTDTRNRDIIYKRVETSLCEYTDANWVGDQDYARSIASHVFTLNKKAISWRFTKQKSVTKSITETEYMTSANTTQKAVWIRFLMTELNQNLDDPTMIHDDNQSAIALVKNSINHRRIRHINVSYHFVRELIVNETLKYNYISTKEIITDDLTKPLTSEKFAEFIIMLRLSDLGLQKMNQWERCKLDLNNLRYDLASQGECRTVSRSFYTCSSVLLYMSTAYRLHVVVCFYIDVCNISLLFIRSYISWILL